ncbi:hypothetical protein OBBRIDRAFT_838259 [Obba rivulosa]|uniref:Secreted protein n=1 Tax=Obba rivulosa TaxID=1052685 RepID=A0A8E2AQY3_9APHY|nr:hypothetical protein OBBRIDRAFT_838259 [Obba rivulosa]
MSPHLVTALLVLADTALDVDENIPRSAILALACRGTPLAATGGECDGATVAPSRIDRFRLYTLPMARTSPRW